MTSEACLKNLICSFVVSSKIKITSANRSIANLLSSVLSESDLCSQCCKHTHSTFIMIRAVWSGLGLLGSILILHIMLKRPGTRDKRTGPELDPIDRINCGYEPAQVLDWVSGHRGLGAPVKTSNIGICVLWGTRCDWKTQKWCFVQYYNIYTNNRWEYYTESRHFIIKKINK